MSVCLYVCITITLESPDVESSFSVCEYILTQQYKWVKFVYEGHQVKVKVKVAGAKNREILYFRGYYSGLHCEQCGRTV